MSEFLAFVRLGFGHILDPAALDHVLFLLALAAVYRPRDWREVLLVVSAFTVGHSITLALAVTGTLPLHGALIEFLIPVTIVATAVENLTVRERADDGRARAPLARRWRPLLAGVFGLVHGAGFAGYLTSLFVSDLAVPLLGFNVGIELGQVVALAVAGAALALLDAGLRRLPRTARGPSPWRLRVVGLSLVTGIVALGWAVERQPW